MRKIELLSPAGNFDCLKAAVNNGANAVYLGGKNFSARAFAGNFDEEELKEAVEFAHLHDVRVFVTLNTLLSEKEFSNVIKMADFYYHNRVDALLIQDLGLYYYLKRHYPDFELHCSTQMHVHNVEGVRNAKKLGFKRVVLARESTLDLIRKACKEDIEIETFVHGALCVSYSGQCLMSSSVKNRSANKGMCAQCCRLRYELFEENGNRVKTKTDYLLSPKDMFLLEDIGDLIDAGVSSFKIEGRMKSPAYVGYVTSLYRKAIDCHLQGKKYEPTEEEMKELKVLFNRQFSDDLLNGRNNLFGQKTPNHQGIYLGETTNYKDGLLYIRLHEDLSQFDGIRIGEFGCIVNKLYVNGKLANKALRGQIAAIETDENYRGPVYKTQDHLLEERITSIKEKKVLLSMSIRIYPDENVQISLKHDDINFHYHSDIIAQKAVNAPLSEENIIKQFSKLNDTVYQLQNIVVDTEDAFLSVKEMNTIRRSAVESFDRFRLEQFKRESILPEYEELKKEEPALEGTVVQVDDCLELQDRSYVQDPVINRYSEYPVRENAAVSEFGGLFRKCDSKIAYYTLN
ncbi:MAG: U32 family peptidase, partial [Erysipelotrichaceae bacterium]|nr:U32 family peptidase [Erysipelotrichaceae bacterium]